MANNYHGKVEFDLGFDETDAEPKLIVKAILKHRESSVISAVATHVATSVGVNCALDSETALPELLGLLVDHKLLTENDRKSWNVGENRIMMAKKINKYKDVILHPLILPFVEPGISVLYQLVCLYEDLESLTTEQKVLEDA